MSDITRWLQANGLVQYADLFREHAIDDEVLADLTDVELKEIGIPLGHRKKLLKAVARAATQDPGAAPGATALANGPATAAWARTPGERKPVTMLFADLTGSTAITERLDAEDTHELLYGATERMCQAIESNGGTVCRYMGDGVMAMFGAPVANEHHALQACKAALEMREALADYSRNSRASLGAAVRIRVGLHSGEAVILRVGEADKVEYDATGATVPIAARMEQTAAPGTILITAATRELAGRRIEVESLPAVQVKGISRPLEVYTLHRLRALEEGVEDLHRSPFVGRRAERGQFVAILESCLSSGNGQVLHVRGEPGVGKTRLVEELCHAAGRRGFECHRGLVLDFGAGKGHDAVRTLVRSMLEMPSSAAPTARMHAADHACRQGWIDEEQRVFLNDLLDLDQPVALRALYDAMDNPVRNAGKRQVVARLLAGAAQRRPVVLVMEDLHWAEPLILAHLSALAAATRELPAILVVTSRIVGDPLDATWRSGTGGTALSTMDLGPLRDDEAEALARSIAGATDARIRQCIERSAGNPLFLEQLLRDVREKASTSIPDSVQSLVMARLDRLASADKAALQAASVLGQRFDIGTLRAILGDDDFDASPLIEQRLVRPDNGHFLFAHALIQEGVYASLVKAVRADLHRRVADRFESRDPVLFAQHLDRGGDPAAPAAYLAAARSEAAAYRAERALRLCARGREMATTRRDRHALACLQGQLLHDLGSIEASSAAYSVALEESEGDAQRCVAWLGLAAARRVSTDYDGALRLLEKAEPPARAHGLTLELSRLHHLRGNLYFPTGNIDGCQAEHHKALECARSAGSLEAEASALGGLGDAAYARGRMHTALEHFHHCVSLCRAHGFGRIEVAYASMLAFGHLYLCELDQAEDAGNAAVRGASAVGARRAEMNAHGGLCHVYVSTGDYELAREHAQAGTALCEHLNADAWRALWTLWTGLSLLGTGRRREAAEILQDTARRAAISGRHFNAGRAFGALALATEDAQIRDQALADGETVLREGSVSHNHFWFHRFAMEALLHTGEWERVRRYADSLEAFTREQPLPYADFYTSWGRALASHGEGERDAAILETIESLRKQAERYRLRPAIPLLEAALEEA